MKTINLFFDFEFTSLSPDAQPISVGIVSDDTLVPKSIDEEIELDYLFRKERFAKSFYAEFSDFQSERCDDWVKENVVSKLKYYGTPEQDKMFLDSSVDEGTYWGSQNTTEIKEALYRWLKQFSDYQIQFVCDCGTWDWWFMVQLLDERPATQGLWLIPDICIPNNMTGREFIEELKNHTPVIYKHNPEMDVEPKLISSHQFGLPKLPENISPVPFDLNDLISIKKGITPKEAFDIERELIFNNRNIELPTEFQKHNSLWDAKVIKEIYNKLK